MYEFFSQDFLNSTEGQIQTIGFVSALIISFLFRKWFASLIYNRLKSIAKISKTEFDDKLLGHLKAPLHLALPTIGIAVGKSIAPFGHAADDFLFNLTSSLLVLMIFFMIAQLIPPVLEKITSNASGHTQTSAQWFARILKALTIIVGVIFILETWGINVVHILAGLGLVGVAVALGAQDLFKNLISGLLIIAEKRFAVGEWIAVEGLIEGTVLDIGFRSTTIRQFDLGPVQVPNALLAESPLANYTSRPYRRVSWIINLEYKTTTQQLKGIRDDIEKWLIENPDFISDERTTLIVRVHEFGPSSIDLMIYCFTDTPVWTEWMKHKEELLFKVKAVVEEDHKACFAFPSHSLYIEKSPTEIFSQSNLSTAESTLK